MKIPLLGTLALAVPVRSHRSRGKTKAKTPAVPWEDLRRAIGSGTRLISTTNEVYLEQCLPEFRDKSRGAAQSPTSWEMPFLPDERTNWNLIDQPDGVCMETFNCGFKHCSPYPDKNLTLDEIFATLNETDILDASNPANPATDPENPAFNLPTNVIFPRSAADVVKTVKFADKHNIELSVKVSGHHYAGASTKAGTLLVNMREFAPYSSTSVFDTDTCGEEDEIEDGLANQPCILAKGRGKPGFVRAGGGETWSDVYLAVNAANRARDGGFKYHPVGGAAGSVSQNGWSFQGGLSGTGNGRVYGLGVDQILTIEAVLPSGDHVRFGPVEWEHDPGFNTPKTTRVHGVCNVKGKWKPCKSDFNWMDLWFAFRGGGGGTFGIVLSMHLQLHRYQPYTRVYWRQDVFGKCPDTCPGTKCPGTNPDAVASLGALFLAFSTDFLFDPEALMPLIPNDAAFSEQDVLDVSPTCGSFSLGNELLSCYSEPNVDVIDIFFTLWEGYVSANDLDEFGDLKEIVRMCPRKYQQTDFESDYGNSTFDDYASSILFQEGPFAGKKAADAPYPNVCANELSCGGYGELGDYPANVLVPAGLVKQYKGIFPLLQTRDYVAWGSQARKSSDQADSVSEAYRNADLMKFAPSKDIHQLVVLMYPLSERQIAGDEFPAYLGANHYSPFAHGPLKEDWTTPCPTSYSMEKRNEFCVSLQEAVWGTNILRRLEQIKRDIDRHFMFDCETCVFNNRATRNVKKSDKSKASKSGSGKERSADKSAKSAVFH